MNRKRIAWLAGKIVIVVFAVYTALMLITMQAEINRAKTEQAVLEERLETQKLTNQALEEDISYRESREAMERVAREKLGLVAPGEIIILNLTP